MSFMIFLLIVDNQVKWEFCNTHSIFVFKALSQSRGPKKIHAIRVYRIAILYVMIPLTFETNFFNHLEERNPSYLLRV